MKFVSVGLSFEVTPARGVVAPMVIGAALPPLVKSATEVAFVHSVKPVAPPDVERVPICDWLICVRFCSVTRPASPTPSSTTSRCVTIETALSPGRRVIPPFAVSIGANGLIGRGSNSFAVNPVT